MPLFDDYHPDISITSRTSMDTVTSSRGKQLNEMCIQSGLRILNGRHFGDSLGQYTSHQPAGSSVIDYFIVSEALIPYIHFFKVHKFDGEMSDHCRISMMLNINCYIPIHNSVDLKPLPCKYKWTEDSPYKFLAALNSENVQVL